MGRLHSTFSLNTTVSFSLGAAWAANGRMADLSATGFEALKNRELDNLTHVNAFASFSAPLVNSRLFT
jgi:hypothetical protein